MNKNPVVESEKTIHDLRKEIKESEDKYDALNKAYDAVGFSEVRLTETSLRQQSEIQKLRSLLKGLLFQYDAYRLPDWDQVREAREYLGTFDKINSKSDSNNK